MYLPVVRERKWSICQSLFFRATSQRELRAESTATTLKKMDSIGIELIEKEMAATGYCKIMCRLWVFVIIAIKAKLLNLHLLFNNYAINQFYSRRAMKSQAIGAGA